MGGKPLAQELAHSAMAEAEVEASHEGEGIAQIKRAEQILSFIRDKTLTATARAEYEKDLGKLGAQQKQRAEEVAAWKERQEQRARLDPIVHKLHEGEKVSLNSIAIAQFKKILNQLSKNQRALVLAKRMDLIDQAAREAPVHLPELHHDEVEHNIQEARAANPIMNAFMAEDEKLFGVKFADAVTENQAQQVAHETGIANEPAAGRKVRKVQKEVGAEPTSKPISLQAVLKGHAESLSYFRAPRNRKGLIEAISDRSDKAFDRFYDKLKEANGNLGFRFELPEQRLLYNYGIAKQLDPEMKRSLQDGILRQFKKIKGYEKSISNGLKRTSKK